VATKDLSCIAWTDASYSYRRDPIGLASLGVSMVSVTSIFSKDGS